jgi:hypothetical protein
MVILWLAMEFPGISAYLFQNNVSSFPEYLHRRPPDSERGMSSNLSACASSGCLLNRYYYFEATLPDP